MKINPTDVKVPLQKTVESRNGTLEVSLSAMQKSHAEVYQNFIANYINESEATESTKDKFMAEAVAQFERYKSEILESSDAGLTPAQKKLPPAIQKIILKKQGAKPEGGETKKGEKPESKDMEKDKPESKAMDDEYQDDECEDGEDGKPCGKDSCAKCKSNASSQKTKNLTKDDVKPIENLDKSKSK